MLEEKRCILIVDDEKKIVRALGDYLKINHFYVFEAENGKSALDVFYKHNNEIDLILLDVMMPEIDGFTVLNEIRKNSLVPVIMLTAKSEEYDQLNGFQKGADDYIPKPFSPTLLLARIEAVLRRMGKASQNDFKLGEISLNQMKRTVMVGDKLIELTRREFDLLAYLMLNNGITLSRDQLLNSVWGYEFDGDERTVDTHIKQLRIKLGDAAETIKTVHRVGYLFEVQE